MLAHTPMPINGWATIPAPGAGDPPLAQATSTPGPYSTLNPEIILKKVLKFCV
jgi:hypothetical protein